MKTNNVTAKITQTVATAQAMLSGMDHHGIDISRSSAVWGRIAKRGSPNRLTQPTHLHRVAASNWTAAFILHRPHCGAGQFT
jgi:hypothetical protein